MNISTRPDRNAVSGPSRDATDVEVAAIKMPVVSCKTAFSCLDRVCGIDGKRLKTALRWVEDIDERVLPLDRLMAIAENSGLRLRRASFNWRDLLIATASKTILLILRNGNIVAVLGTGRDGVEEIVVSDPLYLAGEPFFLPRVALEHAWDGNALIVRPKRTKSERAVAWLLSIFSICGLTAGLLLLFQAVIDVTVAGSTTTYGENAPPISASLSASNPPSQETPAAVSTDIPSGADTTADDTIPQALTIMSPTTPDTANTAAAEPPEKIEPSVAEALPVPETTTAASGNDGMTPIALQENTASPPSPAADAPPLQSANTTVTPSAPTGGPSARTSAAEFTAYEVAALLARGASLITRGDAALARLFYEPAPEAGDGQAALRPGASYGPAPAHQPVSTDVLRPRDRRAPRSDERVPGLHRGPDRP
jgi:hypothetical protein